MTEILTESFCERCGTRYTFESARPRARLKGVKVLSRGLKNFVLSDGTSMDEAMASARNETDRELTAHQLDAFHRTFNFCMSCRQYTCPNCWNEVEARCLTCAPHLGHEILPAPFPDLGPAVLLAGDPGQAIDANGTNGVHPAADLAPEAWPEEDAAAAIADADEFDVDAAARLEALTARAAPVEPQAPNDVAAGTAAETGLDALSPVDASATELDETVAVGTEIEAEGAADFIAADAERQDQIDAVAATTAIEPDPTVAVGAGASVEADATEVQAVEGAAPDSEVGLEPAAQDVDGVAAATSDGPGVDPAALIEAAAPDEFAATVEPVEPEAPIEVAATAEREAAEPAEPEAPLELAATAEPDAAEPIAAEAQVEAAAQVIDDEVDHDPLARLAALDASIPDADPTRAADLRASISDKTASQTGGLLRRFRPGQNLDDELAAYERDRAAAAATPAIEPMEPVTDIAGEELTSPAPAATPGRDVVAQPTWRMVAPDPTPAPVAPPAQPGSLPTNGHTAKPDAEPQWPTRPEWLGGTPAAGLPFLDRAATPQGGIEALWAESNREVATGPASGGRPANGGIQPCVSCGLSLSANARFCRRCGTLQTG